MSKKGRKYLHWTFNVLSFIAGLGTLPLAPGLIPAGVAAAVATAAAGANLVLNVTKVKQPEDEQPSD